MRGYDGFTNARNDQLSLTENVDGSENKEEKSLWLDNTATHHILGAELRQLIILF